MLYEDAFVCSIDVDNQTLAEVTIPSGANLNCAEALLVLQHRLAQLDRGLGWGRVSDERHALTVGIEALQRLTDGKAPGRTIRFNTRLGIRRATESG